MSLHGTIYLNVGPRAHLGSVALSNVEAVPKDIELFGPTQLFIDGVAMGSDGHESRCAGRGLYNATLDECRCFDTTSLLDSNCVLRAALYSITSAVGEDVLNGIYEPLTLADLRDFQMPGLARLNDQPVAFRRRGDHAYQCSLLAWGGPHNHPHHHPHRRADPPPPPPAGAPVSYFWLIHRLDTLGQPGLPLLRTAQRSFPPPLPGSLGWYVMDPRQPPASVADVEVLPSYSPDLMVTGMVVASVGAAPSPAPPPPNSSASGYDSNPMLQAGVAAAVLLALVLLVLAVARKRRQHQRAAVRLSAPDMAYNSAGHLPLDALQPESVWRMRAAFDRAGAGWRRGMHSFDASGFHQVHYLVIMSDAEGLEGFLHLKLASHGLLCQASSHTSQDLSPALPFEDSTPVREWSGPGGDVHEERGVSSQGSANSRSSSRGGSRSSFGPSGNSAAPSARRASPSSDDGPVYSPISHSSLAPSSPATSSSVMTRAASVQLAQPLVICDAASVSHDQPFSEPCAVVDVMDARGHTPLMLAVIAQEAECLALLLAAGADPAVRQPDKAQTALHLACLQTTSEADAIVLTLLDAAAPSNVADAEGSTPLMYAACKGSVSCVQALIKAGADLLARDAAGWTALMAAARYGHGEVASCLLRPTVGLINLSDGRGWTALHWAVVSDEPSVVLVLLGNRALNMSLADANGDTALHHAARRGLLDMILLLTRHRPPQQVVHLLLHRNHEDQSAVDVARSSAHDTCAAELERAHAHSTMLLTHPTLGSGQETNKRLAVNATEETADKVHDMLYGANVDTADMDADYSQDSSDTASLLPTQQQRLAVLQSSPTPSTARSARKPAASKKSRFSGRQDYMKEYRAQRSSVRQQMEGEVRAERGNGPRKQQRSEEQGEQGFVFHTCLTFCRNLQVDALQTEANMLKSAMHTLQAEAGMLRSLVYERSDKSGMTSDLGESTA